MANKWRWILAGLIYCLFVTTSLGEEVSVDVARKVAESWFKYHSPPNVKEFHEIHYKIIKYKEINSLYLFEYSPKGFVIVSTEDRTIPVMGYSYETNIDSCHSIIPLNNWLNMYGKEIDDIRNMKSGETNKQWDQILNNNFKYSIKSEEVAPIIKTTWNQSGAYNNYTPIDNAYHTPAGCVAVAMAQIMRYWEHPEKGFGEHSYTHDVYGTLSANFDTTYYDWDNMPLHNANDNIAFLLYQVGVSINMDYNPSGSGSTIEKSKNALETYFDYNTDHIRVLSKTIYSSNKKRYPDILKSELLNGRPIEYRGSSDDAGHAFVFDGFIGDYFHVNWGWGGNSDGYFTISALGNYSMAQECLIGIHPADTTIFDKPFNLNIIGGDNIVYLKWTGIQLYGGYQTYDFSNYNIYRDGAFIGTSTESFYNDSTVENGTEYSYYITSIYTGQENGESVPSVTANVLPWQGFELPYFEDFEEGRQGWTIKNSIDGFRWGNASSLELGDGNITNFMGVNSGIAGQNHVNDYLISCSMDLSGKTNLVLKFDYVLRRWNDFDHLKIFYKEFDSDFWVEIEDLEPTGDWNSWTTHALYLPSGAMRENVQLAFYYDDSNDIGYGAGIDNISIYELTNLPVPDFSVDISEFCVANEVKFSDLSTGQVDKYFWDFGTNANPPNASTVGPHIVTYSTAGPKTISLKLNDLDLKTMVDYITVYAPPRAEFIYYNHDPEIWFYDRSLHGTGYFWDFGDNTTGEGADYKHSYKSSGSFIVTEIVTNEYCMADTVQKIVNVIGSGIEDQKSDINIILYPNPNKGTFSLNLSNIIANRIKLSVFNILGEKVFEENYSGINTLLNYTMRLDNAKSGIYFIKIHADNKLITRKFLIN